MLPSFTACEYGPMALGAFEVEIISDIVKTLPLDYLDTEIGESFFDLFYVLKVSRFERQPDVAAVNVAALGGVLIVHGGYVAALLGDYLCDVHQLAGLVDKLDVELAVAARHKQTSGDDA